MKIKSYHLEIYIGKSEDPIQTYHSHLPFGAINKGDYIFADTDINPEPEWYIGNRRVRLVVQEVEHRFWTNPTGKASHQIAVSVIPEKYHLEAQSKNRLTEFN